MSGASPGAGSGAVGGALAAVYALGVYAFIYLPVAVLVTFSFHDGRLPIPPFRPASLRWYEAVADDGGVTGALLNALAVGAVSAAAATALGFLAAWGLARGGLPGARAMQWLITVPITVSYLIIALGLSASANLLGLSKALWMVAVGHTVINVPLAFAILYAAMGPAEAGLERAARDLGASEVRVLWHITLPVLWPSALAAFALALTFSWDEFVIAFLLTRFEVTLPVEIWSLMQGGLSPKTNAAGSVVFLVSVVLMLGAELALARGRQRRARA
ncbi:MAG: ABC transporter permease subunit [Pseudomonadota bacterium]